MTTTAPLVWSSHSAWLAMFGLGFAVGGVMLGGLPGRDGKRKHDALAKDHPDEPWLWRQDWAAGVIHTSALALVAPLLFATVWTAFVVTFWVAAFSGSAFGSDAQVLWWFGVPFSIMNVLLVGWAFACALRWRKYGRCVFEMASVPGVIGGQLAGVIRTPSSIEPEDGFHVKLSCVNCVTTRGSKGHTSHTLVWQDEQVVGRDMLDRGADQSAIPVLFQIPFECRQTDESDPASAIYWTLGVTARMRGPDFSAEFRVPVFKTPQSDPHYVVDRSLIAPYAMPEDPERDLREAGVIKTTSPAGDGWRFVFPMARHPGAAAGFTVGAIMCLGVPVFLWFVGDMGLLALPFYIVFGLFGMLLTAISLQLWFYRSVVDASRRGLAIKRGLCGFGPSRWIDASDVVAIETKSNMKTEKLMYFDLIIVCRGERRVAAGKWLPGKRLAASVIREMEEAVGKEQDAASR